MTVEEKINHRKIFQLFIEEGTVVYGDRDVDFIIRFGSSLEKVLTLNVRNNFYFSWLDFKLFSRYEVKHENDLQIFH